MGFKLIQITSLLSQLAKVILSGNNPDLPGFFEDSHVCTYLIFATNNTFSLLLRSELSLSYIVIPLSYGKNEKNTGKALKALQNYLQAY